MQRESCRYTLPDSSSRRLCMATISIYHSRCPDCGTHFGTRLREKAIRLGPEIIQCRCGTSLRSGLYEWSTLPLAKKFEYLLSEWEIGILVVALAFGALAMVLHNKGRQFQIIWQDIYVPILIAMAPISIFWLYKSVLICASLMRTNKRRKLQAK